MNNPVSQIPDPPTGLTPQVRNAFRVAMVKFGGDIVATAFIAYFALQTGAWQLRIIVGMSLLMLLVDLISLRLIRRNRIELGLWLIPMGLLVMVLSVSALVAGLGVLLGPAALILIMLAVGQTMPQKGANQIIFVGVMMGIATMLLDLFGPEGRLAVPEGLLTFFVVMAGVMVLLLGFFVVRQFANYTLRTKLVIAFIMVSILSVAAVAFLANRSAQTALTDVANQALFGAAKQTAARLDTFITTNLRDIEIQARSPVLVKFLQAGVDQPADNFQGLDSMGILRSLLRKNPEYIWSYALLDKEGQNVLDTFTMGFGTDESDRDYFQVPFKTGRSYVSSVQFSPETGQAFLYFSSPIHNPAGDIIGIVRVRYDAAVLQELVKQSNDLVGEQSFAILLEQNYIRLAHGTDEELVFKTVTPLDPVRLAELQAAGRLPEGSSAELATNLPDFEANLARADTAEPYFAAEAHSGDEAHLEQVAVAKLSTQPWLVTFAQGQEVFLAPIEEQTRATLLLVVGVAIAAAGTAFGFGQFLAGPIIRLTAVAQQVAGGDIEAQARVESQDETGQLAEAFNRMTAQLRHLIGSLEDQVEERTAELTLSMAVGQRAAAIRDLAELLPTITEFIREQFHLYYTQVYFLDDLGQNVVLEAGTGTVGEQLLARHHSLPVGPGSIVGRVAAEGQAIVVPDTETSDIHHPNPLLPDTRSELAVPLIVEDKVIGVLDMQATEPDTFTVNNLTVFEALATQLAISIDSAWQWALTQAAQQRAEEAVRQLTRETWAERLSARRGTLGFAYDLSIVAPISQTAEPRSQDPDGLAASLVVQNQPIGRLSVEIPVERPVSGDEQELLKAVAEQLAQKAENLRLFEQTEQRAAREQIARQITDKIRASRDIETALKTAAEELTKALGTSRAVIDLQVTPEDGVAE